MKTGNAIAKSTFLSLLFLFVFLSQVVFAAPSTILDEWSAVPLPSAPPLKSVVIDPQTAAFLILRIKIVIHIN